jgi:NADH:quinone reductase (non-electrogenic)
VHLYYLIGFENRLIVLMRWAYYFFTRGRGGRIITDSPEREPAAMAASAQNDS